MDDCLAKPIDEIALQSIIEQWAPNAQLIEDIPTTLTKNHTDHEDVKLTDNKSFDWSLALKQSAGKADLAKEMLIMLLNEFSDIRDMVEHAIDGDLDNEHFTQSIHKFHGGCSYSGVPKLKNIAKLIEKELKLGTVPNLLEPELLELLDELSNVEKEAQSYLD